MLNDDNDDFGLASMQLTDKFDVLRGRLLGNHNDFHVV